MSGKSVDETRADDAPSGYSYFWRSAGPRASREAAIESGRDILHPTLKDPNYLTLVRRRRILKGWFDELPEDLRVLDVGGRLQPWRELMDGHVAEYVALDPILEGLVDVVGVGARLPFADNSFDLVLCTQALGYTSSPQKVCDEVHRVLNPGGVFVLTVPALLPNYHDCRWLFMPDGVEVLLGGFHEVDIVPEGGSIRSFFRLFNLLLDTLVHAALARSFISTFVYPISNIAGKMLGKIAEDRSEFAANYCCRAVKEAELVAPARGGTARVPR